MKKIKVQVTFDVEVTLDDEKFTQEFLHEFSEVFYDLDGIEGHAEHLAQLYVRGIADNGKTFIEGYGPAENMGISFKTLYQEQEVQP